MNRSDYLPNQPLPTGFVKLPRISHKLSHSLNNSMTTILAGPGYGKTSLVSEYVKKLKLPIIWISLSVLDNNPAFFWKTLSIAAQKELPEVSDIISRHTFPETIDEMSAFVMDTVLDKVIEEKYGKIVLITDNYELITNTKISNFFFQLHTVNLLYAPLNIHQIIIANENIKDLTIAPSNISVNQMHQNLIITARDLSLNIREIQSLFSIYGKNIKEEEAQRLLQQTEGWPLMLHIIAADSSQNMENLISSVYKLFEKYYFGNYSIKTQEILTKLIVFQSFSHKMISDLTIDESKELYEQTLEIIIKNPFIEYSYEILQFRFLIPYRDFLISTFFSLESREQIHTLSSASSYPFDSLDIRTIMTLYIQTKNYEGLSKYLILLAPYNVESSYIQAFLQFLLQIPKEYRDTHPWIDFFIALLHFKARDLELSKSAFYSLIDSLDSTQPEYKRIIGESYVMLANISIAQNRLFDLSILKEHIPLLSDGSIMSVHNTYSIVENSGFFLPPDEDITIQDMVDYISDYTFCISQINKEQLAGYDYLFHSEAQLMTCDYEKASYYAKQAVFKASIEGQHGIVLNAYHILVRIAFALGNYSSLKTYYRNGNKYYKQYTPHMLHDLNDIFQAIYGFYLENFDSVPEWIKEGDLNHYRDKQDAIGRNIIACALYALYEKDYPKFHTLVDELNQVTTTRGLWPLKVRNHILYSISYLHLDRKDKALAAFRESYDMVYKHNISFLFMELGTHILPIIQLVRRENDPYYDDEWLKSLENKTREFVSHLESIQKTFFHTKNSKAPVKTTLTPREKQVLKLLTQGLSRAEIALSLNISVSGVQKFLSNIYLKLGAKNGADAVSIALSNHIV
ncbi:LuxR family maltose regulon positive regulatory protein [Aequitasia blattaphilus]|uniref:LuxR C-terminal-related transcriptional regulator n=1 Tax=Aequitasia blattaphilus TaxID=2949332 RepID=A0ABT1EA36_9FIRM|nr:LuxR C-terminal-related transcriptional regulator [Aequitasia blattaphilus]MCP1102700.1 LuxR C-terminal-related transcriptional regulator [Aequitasia blattaphilus]MCR8615340.1 LuxR C-terminal-related transcriptional regulator [Aequitasia blattaphilus]